MTMDARETEKPMDLLPAVVPGAGFQCLSGVVVLDLTTSVAGPYAAQLLGDFGARVIKVERAKGGDDSRRWGPPFLDGESLWFLSVNRNKESIALDFTHGEGLAVLDDLVRASDVVITSHPPRSARKLKIDAQRLRALRPGLVHVAITGFGSEGERADDACYDLIAEGYAGIMDLTGEPDQAPQKIGAPAADMLAGQDAAMAAMAALIARSRTGEGTTVDISLVESMARFSSCRIVPYLGSGEVFRRSGGRDSVIAIYQVFETADEPVTIGLGNDSIWTRFWTAIGEPDFGARPEFSSNEKRRARRPEIVAHIASIFARKTRSYWLETLRAARVPAGPINRLDQLTGDPEFQRRGLFFTLSDGARSVPQVGTGIRLDGRPSLPRSAPPRHGEHGAALLREFLEYNQGRINTLVASGALSVPS